jgi:hypothetical protein
MCLGLIVTIAMQCKAKQYRNRAEKQLKALLFLSSILFGVKNWS